MLTHYVIGTHKVNSPKKAKLINIAEWLYWQARYEAATASQEAQKAG